MAMDFGSKEVNLLKVNGLNCVENNMLMHGI